MNIRHLVQRVAIFIIDRFPNKYTDAWVLSDRGAAANDNGEHLFKHLRNSRPDINARYVLDKTSPDWKRLVREGYGPNLVPARSLRWRLLLSAARVELSSHTMNPSLRWRRPETKRVFLTHGVLNQDLSSYYRKSSPDLTITTTVAEHSYLKENAQRFGLSPNSISRTGMPRLDSLYFRNQKDDRGSRNIFLIAPTWRRFLTRSSTEPDQEQNLFSNSEYFKSWLSLLSSERLASLAEQHEARITFLPHPQSYQLFRSQHFPANVSIADYDVTDIQDLFVKACLLITDYSGIGFDLASIGRPVFYYQFDYSKVFGSAAKSPKKLHTYDGTGYFNYERDGFGPVSETLDSLLDDLELLAARGFKQEDTYYHRANFTFSQLDGKNCKRVVSAVERMLQQPY